MKVRKFIWMYPEMYILRKNIYDIYKIVTFIYTTILDTSQTLQCVVRVYKYLSTGDVPTQTLFLEL